MLSLNHLLDHNILSHLRRPPRCCTLVKTTISNPPFPLDFVVIHMRAKSLRLKSTITLYIALPSEYLTLYLKKKSITRILFKLYLKEVVELLLLFYICLSMYNCVWDYNL